MSHFEWCNDKVSRNMTCTHLKRTRSYILTNVCIQVSYFILHYVLSYFILKEDLSVRYPDVQLFQYIVTLYILNFILFHLGKYVKWHLSLDHPWIQTSCIVSPLLLTCGKACYYSDIIVGDDLVPVMWRFRKINFLLFWIKYRERMKAIMCNYDIKMGTNKCFRMNENPQKSEW